jgi:monovalent cation/hydrogen antiporter
MQGMTEAVVLLFISGSLAVTAVARRWNLPAPLVLVVVGLGVSLIPAMPHIELSPEILLGVILPPLLFSAANGSSYQDFRTSLHAIVRLGVGLVIVTALAVAWVATLLLPDLPFAAALVLGAVVAPPDAVSAAAVGRRLGLPRRVMTLLGGESLINDATSLTLYKVALAGVATGAWVWTEGISVFALAVVIGVGVGLVMGVGMHAARLRLDDPLLTSVAGLVLPFAAYWIAEELSGSGVLAVVAAGLYLGHTAPTAGYETRLVEEPLWDSLDLLLEAITFALIGLQLPVVLQTVVASDEGLTTAVWVSLASLAVAMAVRPLYVFATTWLDRIHLRGSRRTRADELDWRESLVVSAAGMRGVVTLAAAAAIPAVLAGTEFPGRATIQLAAFTVAIGTLLLQGVTLPWVIRRLGIGGEDEATNDAAEEARVRRLMAQAQAQAIDRAAQEWAPVIGEEKAEAARAAMSAAVVGRAQAAARLLSPETESEAELEGGEPATPVSVHANPTGGRSSAAPRRTDRSQELRRINALRADMNRAQRQVLVDERDAGRLNEAVMRRILRELDIEAEALAGSWVNRI